MSTAFDYGENDSDNPFDASYEEYLRTEGGLDARTAQPSTDESEDVPDDPEVTQASVETADFASPGVGDGVKASWSNLAETTEGDPFAVPSEETADEG